MEEHDAKKKNLQNSSCQLANVFREVCSSVRSRLSLTCNEMQIVGPSRGCGSSVLKPEM